MKKVDFSGITAESIVRIAVLILAIVNAVLQMLGHNTLPITEDSLSVIISAIFLGGTSLYAAYKNFNTSTAAQTAQRVTEALKNGSLAIEEVEELLSKDK